MVRKVSQAMPKKTTVASGLCTSAPMPVESIIGTNPRAATVPVISTGRSRASRACSIASRLGTPWAIRSRM